MRRLLISTTAVALLLSLSGCGSKSNDSAAATAGAPAGGSTMAAAAGEFVVPTDLDQGPRAGSEPVNDALAEQGEKLFQTRGCSACHAFGRRVTGPDLDGVTQRRTAKWITTQILHPDAMVKQDPTARQLFAQFSLQMPKQGLTQAEAETVLEFFKHRNHETGEKH